MLGTGVGVGRLRSFVRIFCLVSVVKVIMTLVIFIVVVVVIVILTVV